MSCFEFTENGLKSDMKVLKNTRKTRDRNLYLSGAPFEILERQDEIYLKVRSLESKKEMIIEDFEMMDIFPWIIIQIIQHIQDHMYPRTIRDNQKIIGYFYDLMLYRSYIRFFTVEYFKELI